MLANPGVLFFNSLDAAGFVTVDKPPFGLWIQYLSARFFGFSGWSLAFQQALAGVGSVALVYLVVARPFGRPAGLVAALALATTPISVAVSRNGTVDALLIFVLLLAPAVTLKAARERSLAWLLAAAVLVGVGFHIKMLQAWIVVPALMEGSTMPAPVCSPRPVPFPPRARAGCAGRRLALVGRRGGHRAGGAAALHRRERRQHGPQTDRRVQRAPPARGRLDCRRRPASRDQGRPFQREHDRTGCWSRSARSAARHCELVRRRPSLRARRRQHDGARGQRGRVSDTPRGAEAPGSGASRTASSRTRGTRPVSPPRRAATVAGPP